MGDNHFIIRVYGIAIHNHHILLCDEYWFETMMTKFPGGGLEYGEGTIDCLKRECMEEFGQEVEVTSHIYTTDYFQATRFLQDKQLISIYYHMVLPSPDDILISEHQVVFPERRDGLLSFRWMPLEKITKDSLTLPVDKRVLGMLLEP